MKYTATLTAVFEINAENIVAARRLADSISCVGEKLGSRRVGHTRDCLNYSVIKKASGIRLVRVRP